MSSGFNTDVRVGDQVFHVQTEDRGPSHPVIDTAIYLQGRVVHRRSARYDRETLSVEAGDDALCRRVEQQHRSLIEDLRAGRLDAEIAAANDPPGAIEVQLLNAKSWLTGGRVLLDIEIVRRSDHQPQSGVEVEAFIEGALRDGRRTSSSDEHGRARIEFPLPPLDKGELTLVIRAQDTEIRFSMRSRSMPPPVASQS
jgi:hypothetical protein